MANSTPLRSSVPAQAASADLKDHLAGFGASLRVVRRAQANERNPLTRRKTHLPERAYRGSGCQNSGKEDTAAGVGQRTHAQVGRKSPTILNMRGNGVAGVVMTLLGGAALSGCSAPAKVPERTRSECREDPALSGCSYGLPVDVVERRRERAERQAAERAELDGGRRL